MARQKRERGACVYVADTECTTNIDYEKDGHVYAYLINMQRITTAPITNGNCCFKEEFPDEITMKGGDSMTQFVDNFIEKIPEDATVWFYNQRYDMSFVLYELMNNHGYTSDTWEQKCKKEGDRKDARKDYILHHPECRSKGKIVDGEVFMTSGKKVPNSVYSPMSPKKLIHPIRSGSRIISVEIWNSRGHKLTVCDVGNKWTNLPDWDEKAGRPMTGVEALGSLFGMHKTDLDVFKYRGDNYCPDEEEILRCHRDTEIIRKAMEMMQDLGLDSCTLASDAWKIYQAIRTVGMGKKGGDNAKKLLDKLGIVVPKLPEDGILDDLQEVIPFEDGYELDMRKAYLGGVTMCNPKYQNKNLNVEKMGMNIAHDDCNSMHPKSLTCPMPYGAPWRSYSPEGEFFVIAAQVQFKLKKDKFPTVCKRGRDDMTTWLTEGDMEVTMTSWDWKWLNKNYDVRMIGKPHVLNWNVRVNESAVIYVDHFTEQKKFWKNEEKECRKKGDADGAVKAHAMYYLNKILMNSLYGKFGQDPKKPWENCVIENDAVTYKTSNVAMGEFDEPRHHNYLPMAMSVTGCSRDRLWTHIESIGWENFLYGDTDSEFFLTNCNNNEELIADMKAKGIDVDPSRLGAWDLEHGLDNKIVEAKFVRAKVYGLVQEDDTITIKTAGLPIEARKKMTSLDDLYIGRVFEGAKKVPRNVKGGQILVGVDFTLKEN